MRDYTNQERSPDEKKAWINSVLPRLEAVARQNFNADIIIISRGQIPFYEILSSIKVNNAVFNSGLLEVSTDNKDAFDTLLQLEAALGINNTMQYSKDQHEIYLQRLYQCVCIVVRSNLQLADGKEISIANLLEKQYLANQQEVSSDSGGSVVSQGANIIRVEAVRVASENSVTSYDSTLEKLQATLAAVQRKPSDAKSTSSQSSSGSSNKVDLYEQALLKIQVLEQENSRLKQGLLVSQQTEYVIKTPAASPARSAASTKSQNFIPISRSPEPRLFSGITTPEQAEKAGEDKTPAREILYAPRKSANNDAVVVDAAPSGSSPSQSYKKFAIVSQDLAAAAENISDSASVSSVSDASTIDAAEVDQVLQGFLDKRSGKKLDKELALESKAAKSERSQKSEDSHKSLLAMRQDFTESLQKKDQQITEFEKVFGLLLQELEKLRKKIPDKEPGKDSDKAIVPGQAQEQKQVLAATSITSIYEIIRNIDADIACVIAEAGASKTEIAVLKTGMERQQIELIAARQKSTELQAKQQELQQKNDQYEQQQNHKILALQQQLKELQAQLDQEKTTTLTVKQAGLDQLRILQQKIEELGQQNLRQKNNYEQEIAKLNSKLGQMQQELEQSLALKIELQNLQAQLAREKQTAQASNQALLGQIENLQKQNVEITEELSVLQLVNQELEESILDLKKEHGSLLKLAEARQDKIQELVEHEEELEERNAEINLELRSAQEQLDKRQKKYKKLLDIYQKTKSRLEEALEKISNISAPQVVVSKVRNIVKKSVSLFSDKYEFDRLKSEPLKYKEVQDGRVLKNPKKEENVAEHFLIPEQTKSFEMLKNASKATGLGFELTSVEKVRENGKEFFEGTYHYADFLSPKKDGEKYRKLDPKRGNNPSFVKFRYEFLGKDSGKKGPIILHDYNFDDMRGGELVCIGKLHGKIIRNGKEISCGGAIGIINTKTKEFCFYGDDRSGFVSADTYDDTQKRYNINLLKDYAETEGGNPAVAAIAARFIGKVSYVSSCTSRQVARGI